MNEVGGHLVRIAFWGGDHQTRSLFWQQLEIPGLKIEAENLPETLLMEDFMSFLQKNPSGMAGFFVGGDFSQSLPLRLPRVKDTLKIFQIADAILWDRGYWWPQCFLKEALHETIIQSKAQLSILDRVYITGDGFEVRVGLCVAFTMGFRKITLVTESLDMETQEQKLQEIGRFLFGIDLEVIPGAHLIMRENDGALLINTLLSPDSNSLLEDVCYLNFLKKKSLVVDFNSGPLANLLKEESEHTKCTYISAHQCRAWSDYAFLQALLGSRGLPPLKERLRREEYLRAWFQFSMSP